MILEDKKGESITILILLIFSVSTLIYFSQPLSNSISDITGGATFQASSCGLINQSGTFKLTNNITSSTTCIDIRKSNVIFDCQGHQIRYGNTSTGNGIRIQSKDKSSLNNVEIKNCNIKALENSFNDNYGIFTYNITSSKIHDNDILTDSQDRNHGIYLQSQTTNTTVENNNITILGNKFSSGIFIHEQSEQNNIKQNNIRTNGTSNNFGIQISTSKQNNIKQNKIITNKENNHGLFLGNSQNNTIRQNKIITKAQKSNTLYFQASQDNQVKNTKVKTNEKTSYDYHSEPSGGVKSKNNILSNLSTQYYNIGLKGKHVQIKTINESIAPKGNPAKRRSIKRYFNISSTDSDSNAFLNISYNKIKDLNESSAKIYEHNNSEWVLPNTTVNDVNTVEDFVYANITSFSTFGVFAKTIQPNLKISKESNREEIIQGTPLNYTIKIHNNGTQTAYNTTLKEDYPLNTSLIKANPAPDNKDSTWKLNNISPEEKLNISITLNTTKASGEITNKVNITYQNSTKTISKTVNETSKVIGCGSTIKNSLTLTRSIKTEKETCLTLKGKNITLYGNDYSIKGESKGEGIKLIGENTKVLNVTINDFATGIKIVNKTSEVFNTRIKNVRTGLEIIRSDNTRVSKSKISNFKKGIKASNSNISINKNKILNNDFNNNTHGIYLNKSKGDLKFNDIRLLNNTGSKGITIFNSSKVYGENNYVKIKEGSENSGVYLEDSDGNKFNETVTNLISSNSTHISLVNSSDNKIISSIPNNKLNSTSLYSTVNSKYNTFKNISIPSDKDNNKEIGVVSVDSDWEKVSFKNQYNSPVVFAMVNSENEEEPPKIAQIKEVNQSGFKIRMCEHEDSDGECDNHTIEDIGYLVIDLTEISKIKGVEGGKELIDSQDSKTISYSDKGDAVVIAEQQTQNEEGEGIVQADNVGSNSATIYLCDHKSNDNCESHGEETVAWLAINPDKISFGEAGKTSMGNSKWTEESFSSRFYSPPVVIGSIQTNSGSQQSKPVMAKEVTRDGMKIRYCEHDSGDSCDAHAVEDVGWLAISNIGIKYKASFKAKNVEVSNVNSKPNRSNIPDSHRDLNRYLSIESLLPDSNIFLNISYKRNQLLKSEESSARIWKYNSSSNKWLNDSFYNSNDYGVNTDENFAFANITKFSTFGTFYKFKGKVSQCRTIDRPGEYVLTQNINSNKTCLTISSDNVKLDCNDYNISYGTLKDDDASGLRAIGVENLSIKNCNINRPQTSDNLGILKGILFNEVENAKISNFLVNQKPEEGNRDNALELHNSNNIHINNNTIQARSGHWSDTSHHILLDDNSNKNIISNNTFNFGVSRGRSIYVIDSSSNNKILNNDLNLSHGRAGLIDIENSDGSVIKDNYMNNKKRGSSLFLSNAEGTKVINNSMGEDDCCLRRESLVYITKSNNTIFKQNRVNSTKRREDVVIFHKSNNDTIKNNIIDTKKDVNFGLELQNTTNEKIKDNTFKTESDPLIIKGDSVEDFLHDVSGNSINNRSILYYGGNSQSCPNNEVISPSNSSGPYFVNCENVTINNQYFDGNTMTFVNSSHNQLVNITLNDTREGFRLLHNSSNNTVKDSTLRGLHIRGKHGSRAKSIQIKKSYRNKFISNDIIPKSIRTNIGVRIKNSSQNRFFHNQIRTSTTRKGFYNKGFKIKNSRNTLLKNNTMNITGSDSIATLLSYSESIMLYNNSINSTADSLSIKASKISHYSSHEIPTSNLVNGKPIKFMGGSGRSPPCSNNKEINGSSAINSITLISCKNITLEDQSISDTISLINATDIKINNLNISDSQKGITLKLNSSNNTLSNNSIRLKESRDTQGIIVGRSSENNRLVNNNILLDYSSQIRADRNTRQGILLKKGSKNQTINNNKLEILHGFGIHYKHSSNNRIKDTNITVKDCCNAVYMVGDSENNVIEDSRLDKRSGGFGAVRLIGNKIANTTIRDNKITSNVHGIRIRAGNSDGDNDIISNQIRANNTGSHHIMGIRIKESNSNTVKDNNITTDGTHDNYGLFIRQSGRNDIKDNRLSTHGSSDSNIGIRIIRAANSIFNNNTIITDGVNLNHGVKAQKTFFNNTFENNKILTKGIGKNNHGILLDKYNWRPNQNNLLKELNIHTLSNKSHGIINRGSSNLTIQDTIIKVEDSESKEFKSKPSGSGDINATTIASNLRLSNTNDTISFASKNINLEGLSQKDVPSLPDSQGSIGKFFNISDTSTGSYINLTSYYSNKNIVNINEDTLLLWKFNTSSDKWINAGFYDSNNSVNNDKNKVFSDITGFSTYGVLGESIFPDFNITKSDNPDPVSQNQTINYTIRFIHNGSDTGFNTTLKEKYDENTSFVNAEPSPDKNNNTWFFGNLTEGDKQTVNITVKAEESPYLGEVTNNATLVFYNQTGKNSINIIEKTKVVDTVKPNITIENPVNGEGITSESLPYLINGTSTDNVGIKENSIEIEGPDPVSKTTLGNTTRWNYTWNPQADGSYTITTKALDTSNNEDTHSISVTVARDSTIGDNTKTIETNVSNTTLTNTTIVNSTKINSTVINSVVNNSYNQKCLINNSVEQNTDCTYSKTQNTTLYNTRTKNSTLKYSNLTQTNISNTTFYNTTTVNSTILNCDLSDENIQDEYLDCSNPVFKYSDPTPKNNTIVTKNKTINVTTNIPNTQTINITVDNKRIGSCNLGDSEGACSTNWNTSSYSDGKHLVRAIANRKTGDYYSTKNRTIYTDNTAPIILLKQPVNNEITNQENQLFVCNATENLARLENISLYTNQNNTFKSRKTKNADGLFEEANYTQGFKDGKYLWNCKATNEVGQSGYAVSNYTITIDTKPPRINYTSPTPKNNTITSRSNKKINVSYQEEHPGKIQLLINDKIVEQKDYTQNNTLFNISFSEGVHTYQVRINDTANNNATTQEHKIIIDQTLPNITINQPSPKQDIGKNNNPLIINGTSTDNQELKNTITNITYKQSQNTTSNDWIISYNLTRKGEYTLTSTVYDQAQNNNTITQRISYYNTSNITLNSNITQSNLSDSSIQNTTVKNSTIQNLTTENAYITNERCVVGIIEYNGLVYSCPIKLSDVYRECGDVQRTCQDFETCSTCSLDCGPCQTEDETSSDSSEGSINGGRSAYCEQEWTCTSWSKCQPNDEKTRTCTDTNRCLEKQENKPYLVVDEVSKPETVQECNYKPTCSDGIKNGNETDIDCGGPDCSACEISKKCEINSDCNTNNCLDNTCQPSNIECLTNNHCSDDKVCEDNQCITKQVENNQTRTPAPTNPDKPWFLTVIDALIVITILSIITVFVKKLIRKYKSKNKAVRLEEYIREAKKNNKSDEEIISELEDRGWPTSLVKKYIEELKGK